MARLSEEQVAARLGELDGWQREGDEIRKQYGFDGFGEAMEFVNRIAGLAEEMDHHPDIDIRFDTVALALSTHSAGGLTERDFQLAGRIDAGRTRS